MRKLLAALGSLVVLMAISAVFASAAFAFTGFVNDAGVRVRSAPRLDATVIGRLNDGQTVEVINSATGSTVNGRNTWHQLGSGGWVFGDFISRGSPSAAPSSGQWIDVDIGSQIARAMIGDSVVYVAEVTTGRPGFPTPRGTFRIVRRLASTTMDSTTIGIPRNSPHGWYLPGVLYTQYFDFEGDALHYNYWMPDSVFGNQPTSHGCVGLRLADARYFWDFASIGTPVRIHD